MADEMLDGGNYWSWDDTDKSRGSLKNVGYTTKSQIILITSTGIWMIKKREEKEEEEDEKNSFVCITPRCDPEQRWGQIFSLCFDLEDRVYISSSLRGMEVYQDLIRMNNPKCKPLYHEPSYQGPINLSHPSTGVIGVDNSTKKPFGTLKTWNWRPTTDKWSTEKHQLFPEQWKDTVFTMLLIHSRKGTALSVVPKKILYSILSFASSFLQSFVQRSHDNFWSEDERWFCSESRMPVRCIRRSWYPNLIMWYFVDQGSYEEPEDGVRCLWTKTKPGDINSIVELNHTLMSINVPGENLPFSIEIPHGPKGEVIMFCPRGALISGIGRPLAFPEFDQDAKYNWLVSTTDREGSASERKNYLVAFEKEKDGKKEWFIINSIAARKTKKK